MDIIKEWALSVVTACAVVTVFGFIVPNGVMAKPFKLITSIFVIICFVSPFSKININAETDDYIKGMGEWLDENELEGTLRNQIADKLSAEIKNGIIAYLDNANILYYAVDVKVTVDSSDNISVK